MRGKNPILVV